MIRTIVVSPPLRTDDPDLRDLAHGAPELVGISGRSTGITLRARLGAGGMSTVFSATLDPTRRSPELSPETPETLAIKVLKPATLRKAERVGLGGDDLLTRETVALGRVMARRPPCAFVIGFYGAGRCPVEVKGEMVTLPWLALELVEGGRDGLTLVERVARCPGDGVDPRRALRLLRGVFDGISALHEEGVLHRDVKPENVLVAGPIDDEVPKLADCGIARVDGIAATFAAMTPAYGGPEQALSKPWERNPLVGPWTDVHALAALAWFVLGGEHWCRGEGDVAWQGGVRRSLHTAARVHPALLADAALFDRIDAVLMRGAAPRLPAEALSHNGDGIDHEEAKASSPQMFAGEERFAAPTALASALFPLLERCAEAWAAGGSREGRAAPASRSTPVAEHAGSSAPVSSVREAPWIRRGGGETAFVPDAHEPLTPGSAVLQPDGKVLLRLGDRLLYLVGDRPLKVAVPPEHRDTVAASRWLVHGPRGGFALVGPRHVLLIRGSRFSRLPLPERAGGGEVGEIRAAIGTRGVFGVVTAETDHAGGGPELWTSDGYAWERPIVLPLGGEVRAISHGPEGFLVVGTRRDARGGALFLPFGGRASVYVDGVNDAPPLQVAQCGVERAAWAAGEGLVLAFLRGAVEREAVEVAGAPVAMGLDLAGVPWIVTAHAVLRRRVEAGTVTWQSVYERDPDRPRLVAIGFTPEGARVVDARGSSVYLDAG
jgi:hypothetical protein